MRHTDQLITDERNTIVTTGSPIILNPRYIEDSPLMLSYFIIKETKPREIFF